ncbi:MAG: DoxX family protein [Acidobacteria bacterium]|nr:DoxX family protein [Acidobacteriota bacterium]
MSNVLLWICQIFLAVVFVYSGAMKSTQSEEKLVAMGQTGVENLPLSLIRFIGISEILGVVGIILPWLTGILPILTPTAAIGLGIIMILAAVVHFRRNEKMTVLLNLFLLLVCAFVAYGRLVLTD